MIERWLVRKTRRKGHSLSGFIWNKEKNPAYLILPFQALWDGVIIKHIPQGRFLLWARPGSPKNNICIFWPHKLSLTSLTNVLANSMKIVTQREQKAWLREKLFLKLTVFRTIHLLKLFMFHRKASRPFTLLFLTFSQFRLSSEPIATAALKGSQQGQNWRAIGTETSQRTSLWQGKWPYFLIKYVSKWLTKFPQDGSDSTRQTETEDSLQLDIQPKWTNHTVFNKML